MRYEKHSSITNRQEESLDLIYFSSYSLLTENPGIFEQAVYRDITFLKRQKHFIKSVRFSKNKANRRHNRRVT